MDGSILETRNLTVGYANGQRRTAVLSNVGISLRPGELVSLIGENGAGKSTLLRTIAGIQPPISGEVLIYGKPVASYSRKQLSRLIGIVSTDRTFAGGLTVEELVQLGRQPHTGFLGRLSDDDKAAARNAMEVVGIDHKAATFVAELSDGERQKTMIARALAQETPILMLDEPTSFLDAASRIETVRLLRKIAASGQKSVLLSSHDIALSVTLSDRLWLLKHDRIISEGVTEDLILGGEMGEVFDSGRNIAFDFSTGEFAAATGGIRQIAVEGPPELSRWIANALRRAGYTISPSAALKASVKAPDDIRISGQSAPSRSVAELLSRLPL